MLAKHQHDLHSDGGIKALQELKKSGDIKAYGMGINTGPALEKIASQVDLDFCIVAMPYTLIEQASLHTGMAGCVRARRLASSSVRRSRRASSSPVRAATRCTAMPPRPAEIQAKVRGIEEVCRQHGVALPAAALQFVLAHPAVVSTIPGAARPSEIRENLASLALEIPAGFWSDLKAHGLIDAQSPTPAGA